MTGQGRGQAAGSSLCDREQHADELNTNGEPDLVPSWGHRCWLLPSPSEVTVLPEREQNDTCRPPEVTPPWPEARHVLPGECPGNPPSPVMGGTLLPFTLSGATFSGGFLQAGLTGALFSWPCGTSGYSFFSTFPTNTTDAINLQKKGKELLMAVLFKLQMDFI